MSTRRPRPPLHGRRAQCGATLIVALILLTAIGLLSVWAFKSSTTNQRVVGNTQARQEAQAAAQVLLENVVSMRSFLPSVAPTGTPPREVDVDGDGRADYTARLTGASCYRLRVVRLNELNPADPADLNCLASASARNAGIDSGGASVGTGDSLCADSEWSLEAEVADPATGTQVQVQQGVAVRTLVTDTQGNCP